MESFCEDVGITPAQVTTALTKAKLDKVKHDKLSMVGRYTIIKQYIILFTISDTFSLDLTHIGNIIANKCHTNTAKLTENKTEPDFTWHTK